MSRGPRVQAVGGQWHSLKSTDVLNWTDKDTSLARHAPSCLRTFIHSVGKRYITTNACNSSTSESYKKVEPHPTTTWGSLIEPHHTAFKTTVGFWWPSMDWSGAPSQEKLTQTQFLDAIVTKTYRPSSESLGSPFRMSVHTKTSVSPTLTLHTLFQPGVPFVLPPVRSPCCCLFLECSARHSCV